jgi:hypothetical protein
MTDFLAAVCFGVFLYGMLFWRSLSRVLLAGLALGLATLIRPTFTALPVLLPAGAYVISRITSKVPARHVLVFGVCSLSATAVSIGYQYMWNGYLGPSPIATVPIQEMLYYGKVKRQAASIEYATFQEEFTADIARRAGRPFATLPAGEQEMYAREIFREALMTDPVGIVANVVRNGVKYVFVPVESIVLRVWTIYGIEQGYNTSARPILGLICLPVWLLSLFPPVGQPHRRQWYYALMMGTLLYVVGVSATGTGSGERIRFPVLVFMLPVAVSNGHALHRYLQGWINRRRSSGNAPVTVR